MGRLLPLAVVLALAAGPAAGHHSLTGTYDSSRQQTIEGTVLEFQFVNPHPLVWLERDGDTGRRWRLEMDNRFELLGIGMTGSTIRPGDRLVVTGSATRDGSHPNCRNTRCRSESCSCRIW